MFLKYIYVNYHSHLPSWIHEDYEMFLWYIWTIILISSPESIKIMRCFSSIYLWTFILISPPESMKIGKFKNSVFKLIALINSLSKGNGNPLKVCLIVIAWIIFEEWRSNQSVCLISPPCQLIRHVKLSQAKVIHRWYQFSVTGAQ